MFSTRGDGQKRGCYWQRMACCTSSIDRTGSQDKQLFGSKCQCCWDWETPTLSKWGFCLYCIVMRAMRFHKILLLIVHGVYVLRHAWLFAAPWTIPGQAPPSMEFSRQEYWSGLPVPSPGDLSNPGIEPASLVSPALAGRFFTTCATWEAPLSLCTCVIVDNKIYGDFPGSPMVRTLHFE